ncbi:hypothetical protein MRX96_041462 [Rhipicephalus microplus]
MSQVSRALFAQWSRLLTASQPRLRCAPANQPCTTHARTASHNTARSHGFECRVCHKDQRPSSQEIRLHGQTNPHVSHTCVWEWPTGNGNGRLDSLEQSVRSNCEEGSEKNAGILRAHFFS